MSTTKTAKNTTTGVKSIGDHLGELRWRIAAVVLVFIVFSSLAYNVREWLVNIILSPIGSQKLVYLTPAGGFSFIFSVTIYAGILATAPVLVYHIYRFITPALPPKVRKHSIVVVLASAVLMIAGVCFGYFVAIPAALVFLTNFAGGFVQPNLTADSYLNFVVAYVMGLGLMFQLPLLIIFWNWIRPFKKGELLNSQRYVLVGAFIAAAMITPTPDVLNQTMIAMPIIFIYQLGVIVVSITNRRAAKRARLGKKGSHKASSPIQRREVPSLLDAVEPQPKTAVVATTYRANAAVKPAEAASLSGKKSATVKHFSDVVPVAGQTARRRPDYRALPHPAPRTREARQLTRNARAGVDFVASSRVIRAARPVPTLDGVYRVSSI